MINPKNRKLTGWLVLLIVWLFLGFGQSVRLLTHVELEYRPYMAEYPSLQMALMITQLLFGASVVAWAWTAWLLFKREPGSLDSAQKVFLLGGGLRAVSGCTIPLLGSFPSDIAWELLLDALPGFLFCLVFTTIWWLYLTKSRRVADIFADLP